ncbi:hypothetical protein PV10_03979 [Exophiala mesophila]|uniref:NACHT domain-containing protein n=1 Tax=Exophiala mesophila TaxID=212818 RepID=A0A0D1ZDD0_EXOME|nr:uncharacterized protein PV10_03979 [Exophiala mesophila]KIV92707.1 hypothetical protein PV10_03979 [Exophiala mesophila]
MHGDDNQYTPGEIAGHKVIIACLPKNAVGTVNAAYLVSQMRQSFSNLKFGLMVGIGAGVPGRDLKPDIRLGDIVVAAPLDQSKSPVGVVGYELGAETVGGFVPRDWQAPTDRRLRNAIESIERDAQIEDSHDFLQHLAIFAKRNKGKRFLHPGAEKDRLYKGDQTNDLVIRPNRPFQGPVVHYGLVASGNKLVKTAALRDALRDKYGIICFEMEAAGITNALPVAIIRGICDYADSHKNDIWHRYAAATAAAYAKGLLTVIGPDQPTRNANFAPEVRDITDVILSSLRFDKMDDRYEEIADAHGETFGWVFDPNFTFVKWLQDSSPIFWISGKAGSGKSTLLKHIFQHPRTNDHLQRTGTNQLLQGGFFFRNRGTPIQKTQAGLLRSILLQILDEERDLIKFVVPDKLEELNLSIQRYGRPLCTWTLPALKLAFRSIIESGGRRKDFFILIDGLDEYESDGNTEEGYEEIVHFIKSLQSPDPDKRRIKVCVSSRPLPVFRSALKDYPHLQLEEKTNDDIHQYIETVLGGNEKMLQLREIYPSDAQRLMDRIEDNANGVFLWVSIVVQSLIRGLWRGARLPELEALLNKLPTRLEELFKQMLENISSEDFSEACRMFKFVHASISPITLLDLSLASDGPTVALESGVQEIGAKERQYLRDTMSSRIVAKCSGLLEIKRRRAPQSAYMANKMALPQVLYEETIHFTHQTVKEFLETPSIWKLIEYHAGKGGFDVYVSLLSSCLRQLKCIVHPEDVPNLTIRNALGYAFLAEQSTGQSQSELLDELDINAQRIYKAILEMIRNQNALRPGSRTPSMKTSSLGSAKIGHWSRYSRSMMTEIRMEKGTQTVLEGTPHYCRDDFLSIAVAYNLEKYVLQVFQQRGAQYSKKGRPLLFYVKWKGGPFTNRRMDYQKQFRLATPRMVALLLKGYDDPNLTFCDSIRLSPGEKGKLQSPWQIAVRMETELEVLHILLTHKANPNAMVVVPTGVTKWGAENSPSYEIVYEEWSTLRVVVQSYPGANKYAIEDLHKFQETLLKRGGRVLTEEIEKDPVLFSLGPRHLQYARRTTEALNQVRKKMEGVEPLRQGLLALDYFREGLQTYIYYRARIYKSVG